MRAVIRRHLLVITAVLLGSLGGCATPPPADDPDAVADFKETNDPLEPTNRAIYAFDNGLDTVILRPAAKAYRFIVPQPVRTGIHNVLTNLGHTGAVGQRHARWQAAPCRRHHHALPDQHHGGRAGVLRRRQGLGLPGPRRRLRHDTGAMGRCRRGHSCILPVFGPSDPRDAIGLGVNAAMDPFTWVGQGTTVRALDWSRMGINAIDQRERHLDDIDSIKKTALDPYATFRSLYRQHRHGQIEDLRKDKRATIPVWFPESGAPNTVTYSPAVSPAY